MSSKSVLKRQRKNIKEKRYNRYKYRTAKTFIKKFKKDLIFHKLDKNVLLKKVSILFSMLDKLKKKKILHCNKVSRIKSKLSNLINKY
ncbi:MAG: 30S ribosomal protein S20 [Candidatus Shikimatogenerans bostrichidophilus]|nr:MAG: 30S ribosomal protein S20 [Candidatus Shikimatogenerans bostrichidophilus]